MNINVNACTPENSSHIFFSVTGKLPPENFPPPIKLPPGEFSPWKIPTWNIPPMFLNIPTQVFFSFNFFFSLLSPLSLILLKILFCNSMF